MDDGGRRLFDFVRAVAIVWIFSYHFFHFRYFMTPFGEDFARSVLDFFFVDATKGWWGYIKGVFIVAFMNGHRGVELFFIASGFGLYAGYLKSPGRWRAFFLKRAIRILPLYWVSIVVVYFRDSPTVSLKALLEHSVFLGIYGDEPLAFGPLWFVSVIVLCYALMPVFVRAFDAGWAGWLFCISLVASPLSLSLGFGDVQLFMYLPGFLFGMLLARLSNAATVQFARLTWLFALGALAFVASIVGLAYHAVPQFIAGKAMVGMFAFMAVAWLYRILTILPAMARAVDVISREIARASYVTFLFHMSAILLLSTIAYRSGLMHAKLTEDGLVYFTSDAEFVVLGMVTFIILAFVSWVAQRGYDRYASRLLARVI